MPINVKRPYKFSKKQKEIIEAFVYGEITEVEASEEFGITRPHFPRIISTIMKQMVAEGDFNFKEVFRDY